MQKGTTVEARFLVWPGACAAPAERIAIDMRYPGFRCASPWAKFFNRFAVNPVQPGSPTLPQRLGALRVRRRVCRRPDLLFQ
jgi:hypothetical protein